MKRHILLSITYLCVACLLLTYQVHAQRITFPPATISASSSQSGYPAANAIDTGTSSLSTYWIGGNSSYVIVDFGGIYSLTEIKLNYVGFMQCDILISSDPTFPVGSTLNVKTIPQPSGSYPLVNVDYTINPPSCRYVKILFTAASASVANLYDLEFFGATSGTNSQWTSLLSNIYFNSGIVSVGTTTAPVGYKLAVGGKLVAEEVVIKLQANWPDYVFDQSYKLPPLKQVGDYVTKNKHLPGVPSAAEVNNDGLAVGEMNAILLRKIEELTLYLVEQDKVIKKLFNRDKKRDEEMETLRSTIKN